MSYRNRIQTFCLLGISFFLIAGCSSNVFQSDIPKILGVDSVEIIRSKSMEELGGLRGKGYVIETYILSDKTTQVFVNNASKNLPIKTDENNKWDKHDWLTGAIDTSFNEVLSVVFDYSGKKTLDEQISEIKQLLTKSGVYYSFYFKPNKDNPTDVQFFVFNTNDKKLYIIESNV